MSVQPERKKTMTVATEKTVRELALENPSATRVFEKLGIDYCCRGNRSLEEACRTANLKVDQVLESLAMADQTDLAAQEGRDWQTEPIAELIAHIQQRHHSYTRLEITRLGPLFEKVCLVHGKNHPELLQIRDTFQALAQELSAHLMKEEMILFPYILRMETAASGNEPPARAPFGSVQNPVSMMEHEHDSAGNALRAMSRESNGYSAPPDACVSYQTLYKALAAFEADLHRHIHLENNILFARVVAMERVR
jgi:regulator of cell morphogenesis and NO signaling